MNESIKKVLEFHETFEHPVGTLDVQEPLKTRQLRIKLLFEELWELAMASDCKMTFHNLCKEIVFQYCTGGWEGIQGTKCPFDGNNSDKIEELDALCDIQYVLNGKIITSGLHEIFDRNFTAVHKNNMNKAHRSNEHCVETVRSLRGNLNVYRVVEKDGRYLLYNESNKLIKPHDHIKVSLNLAV